MSGADFAAGRAARWLPRALALALVLAAWLAAGRIEPRSLPVGGEEARILVVVLGVLGAWWALRQGGELRRRVALDDEAVTWTGGARATSVAFADLDALGWVGPFGAGRRWIPALLLIDRSGVAHRVPALFAHGDELVRRVVAASGASHLASWAEALGLERRMARWRLRVAGGYAVAAALVAGAAAFRLGGG